MAIETDSPKTNQPQNKISGVIVRSAIIISIGNILTRIFGLLRDSVLAALFGTGSLATAFIIADNTLSIFFDLLVSGAISSALVPVLSRYATKAEDRAEFWRVVNILLTLGLVFLVAIVAILEIFADPLTRFMSPNEDTPTQDLTVSLVRVILFAIIFLGIASIMMAALQALQRFVWTAFSLAARNLGIVLVAVVFGWWWGVWSMVVGVLFGTFLLIVLQAPGLRDMALRPSPNFRHPAVWQILKLYLPIFLGLIVTSVALIVDRNLANQTGKDSIAAMRYATNLQQFALGLVGSALSLAILPTLSQQAEEASLDNFRATLMNGMKLLSVLIIPATIGLLALALPIITIIYQRGAYNNASKDLTLIALIGYLPGLVAAAYDQMLIFAFYARKNTLTPVLVGVAANLAYLGLAYSTYQTLGMFGLVLANSLQQVFHMVVMFVLLRRLLGALRGDGLIWTIFKATLAAMIMGGITFLSSWGITAWLGANSFLPGLLAVVVGAILGVGVYYLLLRLLKVTELNFILNAVISKIKKK